MKVITEERLILLRNNLAETGKNKEACLIDYLITDVLKEIDILTVSKLRLIFDLDIGRQVLIYCKDDGGVYFFGVLRLMEDAFLYDDDGTQYDIESMKAIGWLPLPIYKPEK